MEFRHLSQKFYNDYPQLQYPEMMSKDDRPYTLTITSVDGLLFAVPLRSDINHDYNVLWTDKANRHGLDFTKAILILDLDYIDYSEKVFIRSKEHKHLLGKEHRVKQKMEKCIEDYRNAKNNLSIVHNQLYCSFSTLQYFEEYILDDSQDVENTDNNIAENKDATN